MYIYVYIYMYMYIHPITTSLIFSRFNPYRNGFFSVSILSLSLSRLWRPRLREGVHHGVVLRRGARVAVRGAVLQGGHAGARLRATPGSRAKDRTKITGESWGFNMENGTKIEISTWKMGQQLEFPHGNGNFHMDIFLFGGLYHLYLT